MSVCPRYFSRLVRTSLVLASALLLLVVTVACGPEDRIIAADVVFSRDGSDRTRQVAALVHVVSEGAAWQATHAAGLSESVAPDDPMAMSFCRVARHGPRASAFEDFVALDLGEVTIEAAGEVHPLDVVVLAADRGMGYRSLPEFGVLGHENGIEYVLRARGSDEGPAFQVGTTAPDAFDLERIRGDRPSAAVLDVPRDVDLEISWSPAVSSTEMFIVIDVSGGAPDLVCRVPDDGSFIISAGYLRELEAGHAHLIVERYVETRFRTDASRHGPSSQGRVRHSVQRIQRLLLR